MKVLVSGATGLVGKALIKSLSADGHEVIALVRRAGSYGPSEILWDPDQGVIEAERIENFDAVVHLAGENISSGRWTDEKKKKILNSRVDGTRLMSETLSNLRYPPSVFISASAIGYYGNRGDELLTETSQPGSDFLSQVCTSWESASKGPDQKGVRTVQARFGVILDEHGGALAKMLPPFRMGFGGTVGAGTQWLSWIALGDVIKALRFVMDHGEIKGPVNFVAPKPVRNAEFTKALGHALGRPTIFPVPAFVTRLAFGEMGEVLLLGSQRVDPVKLKESGFSFEYPSIDSALNAILHHKTA